MDWFGHFGSESSLFIADSSPGDPFLCTCRKIAKPVSIAILATSDAKNDPTMTRIRSQNDVKLQVFRAQILEWFTKWSCQFPKLLFMDFSHDTVREIARQLVLAAARGLSPPQEEAEPATFSGGTDTGASQASEDERWTTEDARSTDKYWWPASWSQNAQYQTEATTSSGSTNTAAVQTNTAAVQTDADWRWITEDASQKMWAYRRPGWLPSGDSRFAPEKKNKQHPRIHVCDRCFSRNPYTKNSLQFDGQYLDESARRTKATDLYHKWMAGEMDATWLCTPCHQRPGENIGDTRLRIGVYDASRTRRSNWLAHHNFDFQKRPRNM